MKSGGPVASVERDWWISYPARPAAKTLFFVFPYAGGAPNTFSQWSARLSDAVETNVVYLPGRLGRTKSAPVTDWRLLASSIGDSILAETRSRGNVPFVV